MNSGRGIIQSRTPLRFLVKLENLLNYLQNFKHFLFFHCYKKKAQLHHISWSIQFFLQKHLNLFLCWDIRKCIRQNLTVNVPWSPCPGLPFQYCSNFAQLCHWVPINFDWFFTCSLPGNTCIRASKSITDTLNTGK